MGSCLANMNEHPYDNYSLMYDSDSPVYNQRPLKELPPHILEILKNKPEKWHSVQDLVKRTHHSQTDVHGALEHLVDTLQISCNHINLYRYNAEDDEDPLNSVDN